MYMDFQNKTSDDLVSRLESEIRSLTETIAHSDEEIHYLKEHVDLVQKLREFEVLLIRAALNTTGGNQAQAARLLKVKPTTFHEKLKKLGIRPFGR
jgi:DNA-binding NtrC family response regulator